VPLNLNKIKMNQIEFKGREVLGMQVISEGNKYSADSKLKGETFSNYALKGFVISVNEKLRFGKDFEENNVFSITIAESQITTDDGKRTVWSYVEYTTVTGEIVMAQAERKISDARGILANADFSKVDINALNED
jgi:hypothetical protein